MRESVDGHGRRGVVQFYNRLNLGDDLLVHLLLGRYRDAFAIPRTSSPSLAAVPGVKMIDRRTGRLDRVRARLTRPGNNPELSRAARSSDALVHIGGSIFIEHPGSMDHWRREAEYYAALPVPYFIVDANFGPFVSAEYPDLVRDILAGAADVCLRDIESYERFADLGNVRLAPDAGFVVERGTGGFDTDAVFSVMDLATTHGPAVAHAYERACAGMLRDRLGEGRTVCLMSFCGFQGDLAAAERILALADPAGEFRERAVVHDYRGDLGEALGILSRTRMIVGTRFHAVVVGVALGIPTLPLLYSRKTAHMLDEIGFTGDRADFTSGGGLESFAGLSASVLDAGSRARLRADAERQFAGVDGFFTRRTA
jgi:colanic acid/amylovoran biosynthesis protein